MSIALTGASGFIGSAIVDDQLRKGQKVIALSRTPIAKSWPEGVEARPFDVHAPLIEPDVFRDVDVLIHLSGEPVAGRWSPQKKRAIAESRIDVTERLVRSLAGCAVRPRVLVAASAVGYYGSRGDEPLYEDAPAGSDFLADLCARWEAAALEASRLGIRTVVLRIGIVLGDGGALEKMKVPFLFGVGGPLGSGGQFVPWIHINDLSALVAFAIDHEALAGPVNAVTPDYATNARFVHALGASLRRPSLIPAPAFALRLALGEFAETVLASQLVIPAVAEAAGFMWSRPQLEPALAEIFSTPRSAAVVRRRQFTQFVPRPIEEIFAFFSDPRNLARITPPAQRLSILRSPAGIERGSTIEYALRLRGIPVRWTSFITDFSPLERFTDVQLRGPFDYWRHRHEFRSVEGGVEIRDDLAYVLPFGEAGRLAGAFVERDLTAIFQHRRCAIGEIF